MELVITQISLLVPINMLATTLSVSLKKKKGKKRLWFVLTQVWAFLLGYFRYINTLEFISYKPHFVILPRFIVKLSHMPVVFPSKGFHVNLVFFFIFVFLYCAIDHNKWY